MWPLNVNDVAKRILRLTGSLPAWPPKRCGNRSVRCFLVWSWRIVCGWNCRSSMKLLRMSFVIPSSFPCKTWAATGLGSASPSMSWHDLANPCVCQHPSLPTLRSAGYSVVIDSCRSDEERIWQAQRYKETGLFPTSLHVILQELCP